MKKTQHYGLCQWDGEDRILREDFNEDNAKLDTAIAEVKERNYFEKLADSKAGAGKLELILDTFLFGSSYMVAPGDSIPKVSESFVVVKPETVTPKNLTQLNFYCASSRPVLSGTKVRVYGVRA